MWCALARSCWKCSFRWSTTVVIHLTNFTHPACEWLWKIKPPMICMVSCWAITTFVTLSIKHHWLYLFFWLWWFFMLVHSSIHHHPLFHLNFFLQSELNCIEIQNFHVIYLYKAMERLSWLSWIWKKTWMHVQSQPVFPGWYTNS